MSGGGVLKHHPRGGWMRVDWLQDAPDPVRRAATEIGLWRTAGRALERVLHRGWRNEMLSAGDQESFCEDVDEYGTAIDLVFPGHLTSPYVPVWKRHQIDHWKETVR